METVSFSRKACLEVAAWSESPYMGVLRYRAMGMA